uniref:RNA-directed DNA polymerase, eukaryota n=1 Tax=Tanacetum cinerariifolium TaxID=118510 RepID=A0A6L2KPS0_TANCI|nr:RNA-directed DNA polymerase, eukaryota [Tanacetum cinerariifolium]
MNSRPVNSGIRARKGSNNTTIHVQSSLKKTCHGCQIEDERLLKRQRTQERKEEQKERREKKKGDSKSERKRKEEEENMVAFFVTKKDEHRGCIMMRNTSMIQDTNGWCWKLRNNKQDSSIPIRNQFHKEVEKIAFSFYITNFPDYVDAKRLWVECQSYGRIVDAFIANKKSKAGKRFGFVRFLGLKNEEQLARSLASIWTGSYHLFASIARFYRQEKNEAVSKNNGDKTTNSIPSQKADHVGSSRNKKSYASSLNGDRDSKVEKQVTDVKDNTLSNVPLTPSLITPALVLDDSCVSVRDLSRHVMGRVKDLNYIPNLRTLLTKKAFSDVKLTYLGGMWVMIELDNEVTKLKMLQHIGVNSWFHVFHAAIHDFVYDERIVLVDIEGADNKLKKFKVIFKEKVYMACAKELFTWTPIFLDHKESEYILDDESLHGAKNKSVGSQHGEDDLVDDDNVEGENDHRGVDLNTETDKVNSPLVHTKVMNNSQKVHENMTSNGESAFNYSYNAHNEGSILEVLGDMIRVLATRPKKWVKELNIKHKVNFLALQETKMDRVNHMDVKFIWGNSNYQYVSSDSADSSGGILCVWEATIFKKDYATVFDNFIAIYEIWISNNSKVLIVVIYAPQSLSHKQDLWDYISSLIARWNGETVVMGDFNEVRSTDERFGSMFNQSSSRLFNHFITSSGLVDVKLEGYSFTWAHPSATKMSKLVRFLISEEIKIKWAIEGDENSKFFHAIINKKHSQLSILGVFVNGDWNTDSEVVKDVFKDHFATHLEQPAHGWLKLNISFPNQLSTYQVADMDRSVSQDEIRVAVWNCGENKSPGPDGYTFEFFRRYWRFIGSDFCSAFECFFENGSFPKGSNSSFITLIPKVMDTKFVTDFIPISLIGYVYKVVTKILANRLAMVISNLVFDIQSAFVANRQILDGPFILKATSDGLFIGIQLQGSMAISHIFYADDAVFLGEWSESNLDNIVKILKCFFLTSGLKINIQKSQVLGVGVPRNIVNQAASLIGCAWYMGVMVGDSILTLLKSILGAFPLYNMSIYKVPKGFLKEMVAIRCNFFNGADPAKRKITWVSWDKVMAFKKNGDGSLWYRVIQALHGASFELHPVNQYSIWCSILHEMPVLISKGFNFVSHYKKRVRDGYNTRFLYDSWFFDQPLRVRFPRLLALETDKEPTVALKLGSSSVDASFRRPVRDRVERQQWDDLNSLSGFVTLSASKDRWICDLNGDGVFRVKEIHTILDDIFLPSAADATRWVKYIPIKINVFAWRARLNRILTRSNIVRRGVVLDSSLCRCVAWFLRIFIMSCSGVIRLSLFFVGLVVGGIWTGTMYCPFQIRMLSFLLFGFRIESS